MTTQRILLLSVVLLLLAGCSGGSILKQPDPVKRYFSLQSERDTMVCSASAGEVLKIRRIAVAPTFAAREFTYRIGSEEYDSDYYNLFLVQPQDMLTQGIYEWFSSSGLFSHVVPASSAMRPNYILESNVTRLYGDYSAPGQSKAVIEIQFFLLKDEMARYKVAFCKDYQKETPLNDRSAPALAAAFQQSFKDILTELEQDIASVLRNAPQKDVDDQP